MPRYGAGTTFHASNNAYEQRHEDGSNGFKRTPGIRMTIHNDPQRQFVTHESASQSNLTGQTREETRDENAA